MKSEINFNNDGSLDVIETFQDDELTDRGVVKGYYFLTASGHSEKIEPYFYLSTAGEVSIETSFTGNMQLSLNTYNQTTNKPGPTFPQTGGNSHLGPGQWFLYFTGSMRQGRIDVTVKFPGREMRDENFVPKDSIEEIGQTFKARGEGTSRPQAMRIAYRRADQHANGKPYSVLDERIYPEQNHFICILTCQFL
ncbi:MAG: hypothetical protein HYS25_08135 [Ignavibacteriales bacterium]|nr:hypothetical protein [Ignavibacteriales bacterium]